MAFQQPNIDPILVQIGPFAIHWYGLMYLAALGSAYFCANLRTKSANNNWHANQVSDLVFFLFLGAVLGGRFGYVLFYNFEYFLSHPMFLIGWNGHTIEWAGMSFHGGLLGVLASAMWYAKKNKRTFFEVTDFIAPIIPLGLFFGRIGNFINGELWGRPAGSDIYWSVTFKNAPLVHGLQVPRHPSQLYEAILEGLVLFAIIWLYSNKERPRAAVSGLFLLGYGSFRFFVEFFREPDAGIGFILGTEWLTKGMLLSIPMVVFGGTMIVLAYKKKPILKLANPILNYFNKSPKNKDKS